MKHYIHNTTIIACIVLIFTAGSAFSAITPEDMKTIVEEGKLTSEILDDYVKGRIQFRHDYYKKQYELKQENNEFCLFYLKIIFGLSVYEPLLDKLTQLRKD